MKNNKGELAFTTIVSLVIITIVLVAVIVWFLPAFSSTTEKTDKITDSSGINADGILKVKCGNLCIEAKGFAAEDQLDTEFCIECKGLLDNKKVSCPGVVCS